MSDESQYCVECERLAGELAVLRAELSYYRERADYLNDGFNKKCSEVAALRAELDAYRNGNRDLHEENQVLRAELDACRNGHTSSEERSHE